MYNDLQAAIGALLSVCDGAYSQDGSGFNKIDAGYCRWIASRYPDWSGASAHRAWEILRKYRGQLRGFGIDYDGLPVPDREAPRPHSPERPKPRRTMRLSEGAVTITFPYEPAVVLGMRSVSGAKFDKPSRTWKVPLTVDSAVPLLRVANEHGFDLIDGTGEGIVAYVDELEKAKEASKATDAEIEIPGLGGTLRPFQRAGVAYALSKRRCFLAEEMGLGKTIEALATVQKANAFPSLVVCPASIKWNWQKEAMKWLPGRTVHVIEAGKNGPLPRTDLTIINYDLLRKNKDALVERSFQSIILDESHYVKAKKAHRTQAAKYIATGIPVRLALTGTPVLNRPVELCAQLEILGRLEEFGGWWKFVHRYCNAHRNRFGLDTSGASNLEELNDKLRSICYVRRSKAEVLPELPDKVRSVIEVDIDNRDEYDAAESDTIGWLKGRAAQDAAFLASIAELPEEAQVEARKQRANDAGEKASRAEALVRIEALKQLAVKGKMAAIREWMDSFLESDQKLVVFAWHRNAQKELLAMLPGAARVFAEDDPQERQAQVDRFQSDEKCRAIVCSIGAGGLGITLTAASNVLFTELAWTPASMSQCTDRCHRIGQKDSVTAWWMIGKDTIDVEISDLLAHKAEVVDAATDGAGAVAQESMLKELVEKLLRKGKV